MANEFQHKDPGTALTQAEYITTDGTGHIFDCQATGDIMYASSATVLKNLGRGNANEILSMGDSCIPAWTASPSVTDLTIGGGCITLSAATDIDLLDNNASALSFDASGKTGIIDIVTTNCSEGVTMSGTLGVTGVVTASAGVVIDNVTYDACTITATAAFTVDATTDIVLDADGDNITFKAGSGDTTGLDFSNSSGTWTVKAGTSDSDLIFQVNDGGTTNTVLTLDGGDSVVYLGGNATKAGELRILEDSDAGCHYAAIKVQNMAASYTLTLPADDGCCGEALTTNGSGTLTWAAGGVGCGPLRIADGAACAPAYSFSGDTNTGMYRVGADVLELIAGGGGSLRLNSDAMVLIKETANGKMNRGLTIQQGGYDTEVLAFKSCDVAHGITSWVETDTYGAFKKQSADGGGLQIIGATDTDSGNHSAIFLTGLLGETANATKTSGAGYGIVRIRADEKDPSGTCVNPTAGCGNLFSIDTATVTKFIVDATGDVHAGACGTLPDITDTYDDAQLVRAFDINRSNYGAGGRVACRWEDFITYNECTLVEAGILGCTLENEGLLNVTGLQRLHNGAIWQLHAQLQEQQERITALTSQVQALTEGK